MKIVACPICGKVEYVAFFWGKDNEPFVDCPEHGVHIALATPLEASDNKQVVPDSEVWLFRNSEALASVKKGLSEAAQGKVSKHEKM